MNSDNDVMIYENKDRGQLDHWIKYEPVGPHLSKAVK